MPNPTFNPADYEVVSTPKAASAPPQHVSKIDPNDYEVVSTPPPAEKGWGETIAGGLYGVISPEGGPLAERVPIIGSLGVQAGERFRAGVDYLASDGKQSYSAILDSIQKKREKDRAKFAEEHPGADATRTVIGALGAGGLPMPGAAKAVLGPTVGTGVPLAAKAGGSALLRIGGALGLSGADKFIESGGDLAATGQAATLGGGIQAGIEALPIVGKPLKPLIPYAQAGAKKVLSGLGGVSSKNITHYLENQGAVRGAQSLEAIKDGVDTEIGKVALNVEETRFLKAAAENKLQRLDTALTDAFKNTNERITARVVEARKTLKQSFMGKLEGLKKKAIPLEHADEIVGLLQNEKSVLGSLSDQADDALGRSGLEFEKVHVLELMDGIGKSLGVGKRSALIGDEAVAAAEKLANLRDRIDNGFDDTISAEDLRGVLQQVRRDINFKGGATDFNSALNGARKEFTHGISEVMKGKIDDYAKIMGRMRTISDSLDEMGQYFNTREQALASLDTMVGGKGAKARIVEDVLQRYTEATGNRQIISKMSEFKDARRVLGSPLEKKALQEGLPEYRQLQRAEAAQQDFSPKRTSKATEIMVEASPANHQLRAAEDAHADALTAAKRYSGWSPASTESRLKSVMGGKSIENRRTLEALSAETGIDFVKGIENRAVADAFEKGYMHGSRNVNLWSILGALVGGKAATGGEPIVKLLGLGFGTAVDAAGPKMTQKALDVFLKVRGSRFLPALEKAAADGQAALTATHVMLMGNPEYRDIFEDKAKASAISRRLQGDK